MNFDTFKVGFEPGDVEIEWMGILEHIPRLITLGYCFCHFPDTIQFERSIYIAINGRSEIPSSVICIHSVPYCGYASHQQDTSRKT